ncbi:MAG: NIPSNAP family protein [Sphingosinicella sp.]|nr:NIPSNAP family protein [Sphingosinicella sp.]
MKNMLKKLPFQAACAIGLALAAAPIAAQDKPSGLGLIKEAEAVAETFPLIEFRQYTLFEGKRDPFIALFEKEFIESQESLGMKLFGQFTDVDDPNRFIWIRGFRDMETRGEALNAFYYGPVWKQHREAANPALEDNDNVLLLRAANAGGNLVPRGGRAPVGEIPPEGGMITVTIYYLKDRPDLFAAFFESEMRPVLVKHGISVIGQYVREESANNFPRLPVREGEKVFVWLSRYDSTADRDKRASRLEADPKWRNGVRAKLESRLARPSETIRLRPTPRSEIR